MPTNLLLTQIGLSEKEAGIYELLLKLGKVPTVKIVTESGIKRTTVYSILESLVIKGLVEKDDSIPVVEFRVKHPYALKEFVDSQVQHIKSAESKLDAALPEYLQQYSKSQRRPGVKFFEGVEGIKQIHREILKERKEILAYVRVQKEWDAALGEEFWKWYYKERKKHGIHVRAISPDNEDGLEYQRNDEAELRTTHLVAEKKFSFEIEKNICGDKVAFLSLKPNEQIAVLIDSSAVSATERAIFELVWQQTPT